MLVIIDKRSTVKFGDLFCRHHQPFPRLSVHDFLHPGIFTVMLNVAFFAVTKYNWNSFYKLKILLTEVCNHIWGRKCNELIKSMLSDEWALILSVLNNSSVREQEGLLNTEDIAVWKEHISSFNKARSKRVLKLGRRWSAYSLPLN